MSNGRGRVRGMMRGAIVASSVIFTSASASFAEPVAPLAPSVAPTSFAMSVHIGWQVNATTGGNVCLVAEKYGCRPSTQSGEGGGFHYPSSVAVDRRSGRLDVAELGNAHVQKLSSAGSFVLMFGGEVNATADSQPRTSSAQRDLCTAGSGDRCKAGTTGVAAGQLFYPESIAVDPLKEDLYVLENGPGQARLDKFTAGGRFVWMEGRGVNSSTGGNFCGMHETADSGVRCGAGAANASGNMQAGAFHSASRPGNLIAVGGPEDLIYVGDEHRVQEFDGEGHSKGEIILASASAAPLSSVSSLTVDGSGGLYLVYRIVGSGEGVDGEHADVIRGFNPAGEEVEQFSVRARLADAEVQIDAIAINDSGDLAVIGVELGPGFHERFGFVYEGSAGRLIGEFPPPRDNDGLTFDGRGDIYVAATDDQEIVEYEPVPPGGLLTSVVGGLR
jgi:hypothetical protein